MKIEPDEFEQWRENPITQQVFKALRLMADEAQLKWEQISWEDGICDQRQLDDLRATARVCDDLCDLSLKDLEEKLGED